MIFVFLGLGFLFPFLKMFLVGFFSSLCQFFQLLNLTGLYMLYLALLHESLPGEPALWDTAALPGKGA